MRRVTLRDVSKSTGLSTYTVSRALNGERGVSDCSRQLVCEAARELGYVPNRAAKELKGVLNSSIAVVTAGTSNAYYLDMMNGITTALRNTGQTVSIHDIAVDGTYREELEDAMVQRVLEARMSGVISALALKEHSIRRLRDWNVQLVFVDSLPPDSHANFPSVTTDNVGASLLVGDHLLGHGFSDWLFLAYPPVWSSRRHREKGLREAAERAGASIKVLECENNAVAAAATLREHLIQQSERPDVLIAGNNPLLLGALGTFRELGIRVPDDMGLVCYDEFGWAPFIDPPVTVLNERAGEIGNLAGQMLAGLLTDHATASGSGTFEFGPEHRIKVPVDLVIRRSCGCGV